MKTFTQLSYKALMDVKMDKIAKLMICEYDSGDYNFIQSQLDVIDNELKNKDKKHLSNIYPGFIALNKRAKELKLTTRTLKNWIRKGLVKGFYRGIGEKGRRWFCDLSVNE